MEPRTRRVTFMRVICFLLLMILPASIALLFYGGGVYYDYLDAYSGHITRGDQSAARSGLKDLEYFHQLNRKLDILHLSWLADKYLFYNAVYHRAAFFYITGDYSKAIREVQGSEGFWGYFLRGNARWRQAQGIYANGLNLKDQAEKNKQLRLADEMAKTLVKEDYAMAVKLDPFGTLPPSWNYDLVSDDRARGRGLMPKSGKIKVKLGIPGQGGDGPGFTGESGDGKQGKKPKDLGQKDGQGPGNPSGRPQPKG